MQQVNSICSILFELGLEHKVTVILSYETETFLCRSVIIKNSIVGSVTEDT
jgi:hypothetical protein